MRSAWEQEGKRGTGIGRERKTRREAKEKKKGKRKENKKGKKRENKNEKRKGARR